MFANIKDVKKNLKDCNLLTFQNPNCSFRKFISNLHITKFRHIENVEIDFSHPITVISGSNKIGKTSILLLLACSHEQFIKLDATKTETTLRPHAWKDVLRFTKYENDASEYRYEMHWRIGNGNFSGIGKRGGKKQSWAGLAKKSSSRRINSKIKDFQVRLIDLDRVCPARDVSNSLHLKVNKKSTKLALSQEICQAFSYIFELEPVKIYQIGEHISRKCFLIESSSGFEYSSYSTASGEDAIINILIDIFEAPKDALILIDELEAGFHPSVQRQLADVIQWVSWHHKKQFVISTHSPTLMSSFPQECRRFIEKKNDGEYNVISNISTMAAFSKMDMFSHPILRIYCEDSLAGFLIRKIIVKLSDTYPAFNKLINLIEVGPADKVKDVYLLHKQIFPSMLPKIGYCSVIDGDYFNKPGYQELSKDDVFFLYPYEAPEKFLGKAYLDASPNQKLQAFLLNANHHNFFQKMVEEGFATDIEDARNLCFDAFKSTAEYEKLEYDLYRFIERQARRFSVIADANV